MEHIKYIFVLDGHVIGFIVLATNRLNYFEEQRFLLHAVCVTIIIISIHYATVFFKY
jgi:hypothetical protein